MSEPGNSLRLKVHLVLETGEGQTLAEINHQHEFPEILSQKTWREVEETCLRLIHANVVNPAHFLVSAHVRKGTDDSNFERRNALFSIGADLPENERRGLGRLVDEIIRQRQG